jgi:hypothetical protein
MIATANELTLLNALQMVGAQARVKDLLDYLPEPADAGNISSRLCKARNKGWATAEMDNGANHWTLTDAGSALLAALPGGPAAEPEEAPVPVVAPTPEPQPSHHWYSAVAAELSRLQRRSLERSSEATWLLRALGDYHQADAPMIREELHRIADWIDRHCARTPLEAA